MISSFARGLVATSPTQYLAQTAAFHAKHQQGAALLLFAQGDSDQNPRIDAG
jgi:hypothetical protein